ncbi:hypothetical protein [Nostoc sp. PA-18-2419]|uniref:hypothetical protein n=1 Tax=Nostoc sp. PA-18-2419 TaxID=2575443 RepID=UPI00294FF797|nr:hypothetical protein [Nostoc sp. PA-18-2419]
MTKPTSGKKTTAAVPPKSKPALKQENPEVVTVEVAAVEVPELTEDEQRDRLHLE